MALHQGVDIRALTRAMALATACALALAVLGLSAESQPLGEARRGEQIAHATCGSCHAVARTGASRNPKAPAFRGLSRLYAVDDLQAALAKGITVGHHGEKTPAFELASGDVGDLLAHIKRIAQP